MGHRVRVLVGLWALAEVVVFVLVAAWIGVGWTLLAAIATTALGWALLTGDYGLAYVARATSRSMSWPTLLRLKTSPVATVSRE